MTLVDQTVTAIEDYLKTLAPHQRVAVVREIVRRFNIVLATPTEGT